MADKIEIRARLDFHQKLLAKLREAYLALVDGRVKSYTIDDRSLTRFDLGDLAKQIAEEEKTVDMLSAMARGAKPRRAVGVIPRDW